MWRGPQIKRHKEGEAQTEMYRRKQSRIGDRGLIERRLKRQGPGQEARGKKTPSTKSYEKNRRLNETRTDFKSKNRGWDSPPKAKATG